MTTGSADDLIARLAAIVGDEHVLHDPAVQEAYEHDATGRYSGRSLLVVRPASTAETAAVLQECTRAGVSVVPQGGHTGLVGGGTPRQGEVILSLRRLTAIGPLEPFAGQLTVGAGVTLEQLQENVRAQGFDFPVDHAARSAATIGGMVATNAGGQLALRYGTMRAQVAGVEAVLADGRVVERLSGLLKDNAGFDLPGLLIGSEGVLAVVTQVRLKVIPLARYRCTALLGVADMRRALEVLEFLKENVPSLEALDYFEANGLERVCAHLGIAPPFGQPHSVYLVAECAGREDPFEELAPVAELVDDSAVESDRAGRERLWRYREAHNETVRSLGVPLKLDVSVAISTIPAFQDELRGVVAATAPGAELILYGHLGDGNVHVNLVGADDDEEALEEAVLRLVVAYNGSISAEHGIGLAKARWLSLCRSEVELELMRGLKSVFDPTGTLSPGRVF